MLMLFYVGENSHFFTELVESPQGSFEGFVIANFNACHELVITPFGRIEVNVFTYFPNTKICFIYDQSIGKRKLVEFQFDFLITQGLKPGQKMYMQVKNYLPPLRAVVNRQTEPIFYLQAFGESPANLEQVSDFIIGSIKEGCVVGLGADQQVYPGLGVVILEDDDALVFEDDVGGFVALYYTAENTLHGPVLSYRALNFPDTGGNVNNGSSI